MRWNLTRKIFLTVGWANNRALELADPCNIPSSSPCLGRGLVRWGQTGESQSWEQTQEVEYRPPASYICAPLSTLLPSEEWGPSECSAPTSPGFSLVSLMDSVAHEWKKFPRASSKLVVQTGVSDLFSTLTHHTCIDINRLIEDVHTLYHLYFLLSLCPMNWGTLLTLSDRVSCLEGEQHWGTHVTWLLWTLRVNVRGAQAVSRKGVFFSPPQASSTYFKVFWVLCGFLGPCILWYSCYKLLLFNFFFFFFFCVLTMEIGKKLFTGRVVSLSGQLVS